MNHEHGIGQTAATILQLLEVDPGSEMAGPHGKVLNMAERTLTGEGSRRVFFIILMRSGCGSTENSRENLWNWRSGCSSV